ncbi:AlpA family transcriptional regulator [Pasteurellaceae bacterium LFhippo2]|nr:AlpA family transcriptional regulator [Pasteurellaceae bacterium LFhippo2]
MERPQTKPKKLISGAEVTAIVGFGRTKINVMVKNQTFPQPIKFSKTFVRWDLDEINTWVEEQKAMRA